MTKKTRDLKKNEKGFMAVYALVVMLILFIIAMAWFPMVFQGVTSTVEDEKSQFARFLAEGEVSRVVGSIKTGSYDMAVLDKVSKDADNLVFYPLLKDDLGSEVESNKFVGAEYAIYVEPELGTENLSGIYTVTAIGKYKGTQKVVRKVIGQSTQLKTAAIVADELDVSGLAGAATSANISFTPTAHFTLAKACAPRGWSGYYFPTASYYGWLSGITPQYSWYQGFAATAKLDDLNIFVGQGAQDITGDIANGVSDPSLIGAHTILMGEGTEYVWSKSQQYYNENAPVSAYQIKKLNVVPISMFEDYDEYMKEFFEDTFKTDFSGNYNGLLKADNFIQTGKNFLQLNEGQEFEVKTGAWYSTSKSYLKHILAKQKTLYEHFHNGWLEKIVYDNKHSRYRSTEAGEIYSGKGYDNFPYSRKRLVVTADKNKAEKGALLIYHQNNDQLSYDWTRFYLNNNTPDYLQSVMVCVGRDSDIHTRRNLVFYTRGTWELDAQKNMTWRICNNANEQNASSKYDTFIIVGNHSLSKSGGYKKGSFIYKEDPGYWFTASAGHGFAGSSNISTSDLEQRPNAFYIFAPGDVIIENMYSAHYPPIIYIVAGGDVKITNSNIPFGLIAAKGDIELNNTGFMGQLFSQGKVSFKDEKSKFSTNGKQIGSDYTKVGYSQAYLLPYRVYGCAYTASDVVLRRVGFPKDIIKNAKN